MLDAAGHEAYSSAITTAALSLLLAASADILGLGAL